MKRNGKWWLGWAVIVLSLLTFYLYGATRPEHGGASTNDVRPTISLLTIVGFAFIARAGAWLVHASRFTREQRRNAAKMKAHEREFERHRV